MLALILAAKVFTPHAAQTARVIIVLIIAATVIFGRRLLYLLAHALIIVLAVAVVVGAVALVQIMHGLSCRPARPGYPRTVRGTTTCGPTTL